MSRATGRGGAFGREQPIAKPRPGGRTASFEALLGCANDIGLCAEETESKTGVLGHFPQGLTHLEVTNPAFALEAEQWRRATA